MPRLYEGQRFPEIQSPDAVNRTSGGVEAGLRGRNPRDFIRSFRQRPETNERWLEVGWRGGWPQAARRWPDTNVLWFLDCRPGCPL